MPTTMSANFDESFGDVDRIPDMRADPLILWENPRLSMMSSMLRVDRELLQDSKLIDLPFLVRVYSSDAFTLSCFHTCYFYCFGTVFSFSL